MIFLITRVWTRARSTSCIAHLDRKNILRCFFTSVVIANLRRRNFRVLPRCPFRSRPIDLYVRARKKYLRAGDARVFHAPFSQGQPRWPHRNATSPLFSSYPFRRPINSSSGETTNNLMRRPAQGRSWLCHAVLDLYFEIRPACNIFGRLRNRILSGRVTRQQIVKHARVIDTSSGYNVTKCRG